jgi:hypothetical protein
MPACPNCHVEYRAGFTTCNDCGATLIPDAPGDSQSHPPEKKKRLLAADTKNRYSCYRFLANVNDAVELAYIKSTLGEQSIPYRVLAEDMNQYLYILQGRSFMGINIYVPGDCFAPACEALASYRAEPLPDELAALVCESAPTVGIRFDLWFLHAYLFLNFVSFLMSNFITGF